MVTQKGPDLLLEAVPSVLAEVLNSKFFFAGDGYLRWILVEAARIHVQWCPESKITKHYEKLKRKRGEKIAIVAAARKLLQAIYYMLRNNESFRIEG